jgi:hypothetical protein
MSVRASSSKILRWDVWSEERLRRDKGDYSMISRIRYLDECEEVTTEPALIVTATFMQPA